LSVNGTDYCRRNLLTDLPQKEDLHRVTLLGVDWEAHAEREESRYRDGLSRLPDDRDGRQKQLVRVAMAAGGAGLARLMQGRAGEAAGWFARSAERYRESWTGAPPGSWGRLIGAVKSRILAGDWERAADDARWALEQDPQESDSPISAYAATLASLALGDDESAALHSERLRGADFPPAVASALSALAVGDRNDYEDAVGRVLESFEAREAYLEDTPVADTVLVLEALAGRRGLAVGPRSALLPDRN
jgi:hypothetical protein